MVKGIPRNVAFKVSKDIEKNALLKGGLMCTGLREQGGPRALLKSTSGPFKFRFQSIGPVQNQIHVCLDKRGTHQKLSNGVVFLWSFLSAAKTVYQEK